MCYVPLIRCNPRLLCWTYYRIRKREMSFFWRDLIIVMTAIATYCNIAVLGAAATAMCTKTAPTQGKTWSTNIVATPANVANSRVWKWSFVLNGFMVSDVHWFRLSLKTTLLFTILNGCHQKLSFISTPKRKHTLASCDEAGDVKKSFNSPIIHKLNFNARNAKFFSSYAVSQRSA